MNIGRNAPCPCGSGKKYKRCHGDEAGRDAGSESAIKQSDLDQMHRELLAKEKQREKQQGMGRPIISCEKNGHRVVAVGNRLYPGGEAKTFHEFLLRYIKIVIGSKWGTAEIKKPYEKRNPILQWYKHLCDFQRVHTITPGQVSRVPMTGAVAAYLHLAYNLYLLGHNAEIQQWLVQRLKNNDNFTGAYYETFVAAAFIKAGFKLEFENEKDSRINHCEFTATYPATGVKFSVEAKARMAGKEHANVSKQLFKALRKDAKHPRVVFIEMNMEDAGGLGTQIPYQQEVIEHLRACELGKIDGEEAPPAYVIVTNFPYHHALESTSYRWSAIGEGFKIPDFKADYRFSSIREGLDNEKKHYEIYQLMDAMTEYTSIPSTFDGEIPEFAFGEVDKPRLMIGHKYLVPLKEGEAIGILQDACVNEAEKKIYSIYHLENGRSIIAASIMTDEEWRAYRGHPETFFGVCKDPVKRLSSPIDLYKWLKKAYRDTPKDKLLEFLQGPDFNEEWKDLSQEELSDLYCEGMANSICISKKNKTIEKQNG